MHLKGFNAVNDKKQVVATLNTLNRLCGVKVDDATLRLSIVKVPPRC